MKRILLATFAFQFVPALLWAAPPTRAAPSAVVEVSGDVVRARSWTLAQLQKMTSLETVVTTLKGKPYTARGVRLWALVQAAAPRFDPKSKGSQTRFVVLARGQDGYLASFALPKFAPDAGNKGAFLLWEANGQPLSAPEGPFRLVVLDDKKPMRWVYNLVGLEIYDGGRWRASRPA